MANTIEPEKLCMGCMSVKDNPDSPCARCGFDIGSYTRNTHQLQPFTILNGKYLVGRLLGEGGFGITYLGWDLNLDIKVAIKEYYPSGLVTREVTSTGTCSVFPFSGEKSDFYRIGLDKFVNEAKSLAKFYTLPGIVAVKDFFRENGTAYIVMEFVNGITMKQHLVNHGGKLLPNEVFELMRPLMKSLSQIHAAGIIHRDISPDNIMLTEKGDIKLLDFGAAKDFTTDGNKSVLVQLKPGYAPEEQYRSQGKQGPWTDIYALCATIYKAITGVTPDESVERVQKDEVKAPSQLAVPIKPQQETALMKGMAVQLQNRYQRIEDLYASLYEPDSSSKPEPQPLPRPEPEPAPPPKSDEKLKPWLSYPQNRKIFVGALSVIVGMAAIVIFVLLISGMPKDPVSADTTNESSSGMTVSTTAPENAPGTTSETTEDVGEYFPVNSDQTTTEPSQSSEDIYNILGSNIGSRANQGDYVVIQPNTLVEPENYVDFTIEGIRKLKIPNDNSNMILQVSLQVKMSKSFAGNLGMADYNFIFLNRYKSEITGEQAITILYPGGFSYAGSDNLETFPLVFDSYDPIGINLYYKTPVNAESRFVFTGTNLFNGKNAGPIYLYEYIPDSAPGGGDDTPTQAENGNTADTNDFIMPYSSDRYLTEADISYLSKEELGIVRNEIYARHGYVFATQKYKDYFANKAWYRPNPDFKESDLSDIEKYNVSLIKQYEGK